jgi:hypothetical protein
MICLEREISSAHFHLSMSLIELHLPIVDEFIGLYVHRPFCFHRAHLPYLGIGRRRIIDDEENKERAQNEPVIFHDPLLGWK